MGIDRRSSEIVIGDISRAWLVDFKVKVDGEYQSADLSGFLCRMSLVEKGSSEALISHAITQIYENQFVVYLTAEETSQLTADSEYILMAQLEGETELSPKPIKTTRQRDCKAVGGFIQ